MRKVHLTNSKFEGMSPPDPKSCSLKENSGYVERQDEELENVFLKIITLLIPSIDMCVWHAQGTPKG